MEKKTEIKVENEEIIDIKDSDMNQNYEVSVPVHNRFEVFDHSKSPSTTALSTTGASHTQPGQLPRTPKGTPPRTPPRKTSGNIPLTSKISVSRSKSKTYHS